MIFRELPGAGAGLHYRRNWAVIIGIDRYPRGASRLAPLQFAVNDAREVHNVLRDEFGFSAERMVLLTDEAATRAALRDTFQRWLPRQDIRAEDALFVFFAGHGLIGDAQRGYLVAVDSRADELPVSCLAIAWIRDQLAQLPCRHKLMVLDSCYSGSLFKEEPSPVARPHSGQATERAAPGQLGQRGPGVQQDDNLAYYLAKPAFLGMSAGRFTPVADGLGEHQHSVFTAALLQELRDRADTPRPDHVFTFRQLAVRVETRVFNALGSRQIPNWGRLAEGDGDFVFRPVIARLTPTEQREVAERRHRHALEMRAAHEAWRRGDLETAARLLDSQHPPPGRPDVRGFEWYYLWRICRGGAPTLSEPHSPVCALAFSPNGSLVAGGEGYASRLSRGPEKADDVFLWDPQTGALVRRFVGHSGPIHCVRFAPAGKRLATASADGTVRLWDTEKGEELLRLEGVKRPVWRVAFNPDGTRLATCDDTATVRIWDSATGKPARTVEDCETNVFAIQFSADGRSLLTAGQKLSATAVRVVDLASGVATTSFSPMELNFNQGPWDAAFSADGKQVAFAMRDRTVRVWSVTYGKPLHVLRGHTKWEVQCVAYSPDGKRLASGGQDRTVRVWDATAGNELASYRGHSRSVGSLAFSPNGQQLASGGDDCRVRVWDVTSEQESRGLDGWKSAAVSPDGHWVVTAASANAAHLYATNRNSKPRPLSKHPGNLLGVAFSPDGRAVSVDKKTLTFWDTSSGAEQLSLRSEAAGVMVTLLLLRSKQRVNSPGEFEGFIAFNNDGSRLATIVGRSSVCVWDARTAQLQHSFKWKDSMIQCLAFTPDSTRLAAGTSDNVLVIWSLKTGRIEQMLRGPARGIGCIAISPDGKLLAAGDGAHLIRLWSMTTGAEEQTLIGHTDAVLAAAFTPDGSRLLSGSADGTIKTWDVCSGQEVLTLRGHDGPVSSISVSGDGRWIVTAAVTEPGYDPISSRPHVRVWKAATDAEVKSSGRTRSVGGIP